MLTGATLFVLVCVFAVGGYLSAGWRLDDAVYMVVITIFGVGFGEVQPINTPLLRSLTMMVIIAGYGAVVYAVGGFMQMLIDGELKKALEGRRMTSTISKLSGHTIICGIGRMGTILAKELHAAGKPFVVVDTDSVRLHEAAERGFLIVDGDATEERVLEAAGVKQASVLATVLSDDALNVFITITARELNPKLTILARAENPRSEKKLLSSGATKVILPTAIGARKLAHLIVHPTAENILDELTQQNSLTDELERIDLKFDEFLVVPDSALVGKPLTSIEVRNNHGFLIVGVKRSDGRVLMNPPSETVLAAGDAVIVLAHTNDVTQLTQKFQAKHKSMQYRGVKIE